MKVFLLVVALSVLASCQKNVETINDSKLLVELGFEPKKILHLPYEKYERIPALSFDNLAQAKRYFKLMLSNRRLTYNGNVWKKKKFKHDFDPQQYIRLITEVNASASDCTEPYFENCGESTIDDGTGGGGNQNPSLNYWYGWTGWNVTFSWSNTSSGITASNFSSSLIGFHPMSSWDHGSSSYFVYPNSALIHYSVTGYQNYNIIMEGIGTVFTEVVTISGIYNTNTGAYTMTVTDSSQ
jgi:hypothetical protein